MNTASVSGSSLITTLVMGRKRRGRRVLGMCFCHDWVQESGATGRFRSAPGRSMSVGGRLPRLLECAFRRHRDKMRIIRRVKIMRLILRVFYSHSLSTRPAAMSQSNPRRSPLESSPSRRARPSSWPPSCKPLLRFWPRKAPLHHCARGREGRRQRRFGLPVLQQGRHPVPAAERRMAPDAGNAEPHPGRPGQAAAGTAAGAGACVCPLGVRGSRDAGRAQRRRLRRAGSPRSAGGGPFAPSCAR